MLRIRCLRSGVVAKCHVHFPGYSLDSENLMDMRRIYGGDPEGKITLLRSWAGEPGMEIDDPWYTRDFNGALSQIEEGCSGLLRVLLRKEPEKE